MRTSSHLQLRPGQDKAKQCDKNNNRELHINKRTVNNTKYIKIEKVMYSVCKCKKNYTNIYEIYMKKTDIYKGRDKTIKTDIPTATPHWFSMLPMQF